MTHVLVTGGMGFIGSNFILYMLSQYSNLRITNLDALTYAGNPDNLEEVSSSERYRFVKADITNHVQLERIFAETAYDAVVHFAAESHVDRSIADPEAFVRTNVWGTFQLLEAAKRHGVSKFIHVSTDEVYGSLEDTGCFTEESPLAPNSPYSASKAGSDLLARAYGQTYGLPVVITRCSNNYGPRQFPEKLIPTIILRALHDEPIPIYGDGSNVRDWLHVTDHCTAIDFALRVGKVGEVYNIGGHNERTNLDVVRMILQVLNKPESLITFTSDRPGHDKRYAIDPSKSERELGWRPQIELEQGMRQTVAWYVSNQAWCERVRSNAYLESR
ncbi:dTDP-glucose 4,6-dehydratase [Paenibacillus alvei]|uniref:dTDP-glucose 4,6-dehydratase n=1 Tax=Paenibacillus alvei TaxID=44250 RepID=A0ABT4H7L0_PAEAL|nr:dTDP-glucose 4,6-dehydratase [Paenibacillus alvei]EJW16924.1 dTDP-glucose 4,6-dehydratase [Paenibacillus alvei DSM 29]MCY7486609.1 dTDP-glucose 4,6-dehydratase [Paenibacillus alvei]MCY9543312.1 dTDP-glucose 4,6-dehydratase [Paenibacillus alvei]MCY9708423.1 dTDP-glucose 4,6-dehydratase [Paenibacillus alvei]MCY9734371.1 dTDP-glucose 4,6-dehydratase [Paenibacillus alvei]